jgi:hypothetical protein
MDADKIEKVIQFVVILIGIAAIVAKGGQWMGWW